MENLSQKKCVPCEGATQPLTRETSLKFLKQVPGWQIWADGKKIGREFLMKDFGSAVELITRIADAAEEENHHPDLHLTGYRKLLVELSTHAIGGLSENDFIIAAKINELWAETPGQTGGLGP